MLDSLQAVSTGTTVTRPVHAQVRFEMGSLVFCKGGGDQGSEQWHSWQMRGDLQEPAESAQRRRYAVNKETRDETGALWR
jgi:hypothetical protein